MSALISNPAIKSLIRGLLVWAPLWILSTGVFGAMGVGYAFFLKSDTFVASQALLVRDEANGAVMRLGRFQSATEMKAAQEMILEMAKSQPVISEALLAVGRQPSFFSLADWLGKTAPSKDFPSKELIEETAKQAIQVHAPKGVEFGSTEMIYVDVKSSSKEYASKLASAICSALESRLQQVRKSRADAVIDELRFARDSAQQSLAFSTDRLNEVEKMAGSDLVDLRGMTDAAGNGTTSKQELEQIKNEIRSLESSRQALTTERDLLIKAGTDPNSIAFAPAAFVNAHPGLKRMREGLVDAQIAEANIRGRFTDAHPVAIASAAAQSAIVERFSSELRASVAGVDAELELVAHKMTRLGEQKIAAEQRLMRLAENRAGYANLASEVKSKTQILENAERELAETEAARDSSLSTSLLTRLDEPIVGDRPIGPGKTTLSGMCAMAGLIFGLGIVFAITPIDFGPTYGMNELHRYLPARPTRLEPVAPSPPRSPKNSDHHKQTTAPRSASESHSDLSPIPHPSGGHAWIGSNSGLSNQDLFNPEDVDAAFRELAKLKGQTPSSREEELAVQSKIQELKSVIQNYGHSADTETLQRFGWTKPRPSKNH